MPGVLRSSRRPLSNEISATSYAAALATRKDATMGRELIITEDTSIKNFTLNFGPQLARQRNTHCVCVCETRGRRFKQQLT